MQNQEKKRRKINAAVMAAVEPLILCGVSLIQVKIQLDHMFTKALENADDDEMDNFSARELSPAFKALSESLLYLYEIPEIRDLQSDDFSNLLPH